MIISKKLTAKRLAEIKAFPISYDVDSPKLTIGQIAQLEPAYPEYWKVEPVKKAISIKIDVDILEAFKAGGKGYQTRINAVLRKAVEEGLLC